MTDEPWCCICERYVLETDKQDRANELVAHEACYLRAKKFFDSLNKIDQSSETHPCEIVEAEFVFGADLCGFPATKQVDCGCGCMHWVCDEHAQAQK